MANRPLALGLLLPLIGLAAPGRTVDIRVVDETGKPVPQAQVLVHSGKENDLSDAGRAGFKVLTDVDGRWSHTFKPKWGLENIQVFLHEDNPQREVYPIWLEKFISYHRDKASYELTLPRIIHPVNLKAKIDSMNYLGVTSDDLKYTPHQITPGTPTGFDLDVMQWLPPHGDGKRADFEVSVTGTQVGWTISEERLAHKIAMKRGTREELAKQFGIWKRTATITFPRPGDGIIRSPQFWPYCKLKMPHRAPEEGYLRELLLTEEEELSEATPDYKQLQHPHYSGYYLRVRSKLDGAGNVVSANYAKFMLPRVGIYGFGAIFFFNPNENDTNLEYSGNNLLWPRPEGESIFSRPPAPPLLDIREH
jgi:hypothetical protein